MRDTPIPERSGLLRRLWGGGPDKAKTIRLPVNAYGKLPIYKDFISSGLTEGPAREFRTWLDRGFSHRWSTDETCRDVVIPPHSFLFRLPDSKGYAAGSLWGSSDEGGLRKFPFTLFFTFPGGHAAADPVAAVEYLADLEKRANELRFLFGPGASLASFYQAYRGAEIEVSVRPHEQVSRDFRSELAGFSVAEFAESVLGDQALREWSALLEKVGRDVPAVRVPLGGCLPRAREVEFWLFWFESRDPKGHRPVTGILYPHGHNDGQAIFWFRDLQPDDFLLLHPSRPNPQQVFEALPDFSPSRAPTSGRHPASERPDPPAGDQGSGAVALPALSPPAADGASSASLSEPGADAAPAAPAESPGSPNVSPLPDAEIAAAGTLEQGPTRIPAVSEIRDQTPALSAPSGGGSPVASDGALSEAGGLLPPESAPPEAAEALRGGAPVLDAPPPKWDRPLPALLDADVPA